VRVGWIQTEPAYGNPQANLLQVEEALRAGGSDLWVLPELFSTGYLFGNREEVARLAEPVPEGPTTQGLIALAARFNTAIIAGIAEHAKDGRLFNSAVAVDPSGLNACYRKIHLFDYEKEWFDPGDGPFVVVRIAGARVGLMICWDWRFPESARTLALAGAQVIAHPSNLVLPFCQAAMVTRALENGLFTITANRIGTEERSGLRLTFTGGSRIVAPDGSILSDGPARAAASASVEIDPDLADGKKVTLHNDLFADRRQEFYRLS
jgi:5-aminopentanamidase